MGPAMRKRQQHHVLKIAACVLKVAEVQGYERSCPGIQQRRFSYQQLVAAAAAEFKLRQQVLATKFDAMDTHNDIYRLYASTLNNCAGWFNDSSMKHFPCWR